jgi:NACalpha-BTF3-like transcription factor
MYLLCRKGKSKKRQWFPVDEDVEEMEMQVLQQDLQVVEYEPMQVVEQDMEEGHVVQQEVDEEDVPVVLIPCFHKRDKTLEIIYLSK